MIWGDWVRERGLATRGERGVVAGEASERLRVLEFDGEYVMECDDGEHVMEWVGECVVEWVGE